jgi:hypothetical protein
MLTDCTTLKEKTLEILKENELDKEFQEIEKLKCDIPVRRKPSEYQKFLSGCLTGGTKTLKSCAAEWQELKGKIVQTESEEPVSTSSKKASKGRKKTSS